MDRLRGVWLPVLLMAMAGVVAFLGSVSTDDAAALAQRAQGDLVVRGSLAPRAEAAARKRVLIRHSQSARLQGLALFGASGLLAAASAVLFLTHLRAFRRFDVALAAPRTRPSPRGEGA